MDVRPVPDSARPGNIFPDLSAALARQPAPAPTKPATVTTRPAPRPATSDVPFQGLWRLGYRRLTPIIPPGAELAPSSSLLKRKSDARGKSPGLMRQDGKWTGFDFVKHEATEDDLARWAASGAGCGIKTGRGLVALDVDTTNEATAASIFRIAEEMLGPTAVRVGRAPKLLMPYRVAEAVPYEKLTFSTPTENLALVELLSDGRQFVAFGQHPGTGKPYTWPRDLPAFDKLPSVTPAQLDAFFARLATLMPRAVRMSASTRDRALVDQATLQGPLETVRAAIEALPNTSANFATRQSYLTVGYALKAALPDDESAAFEMFAEWCARWQDGENAPAEVEADWSRMKPPFEVGAQWLYDHADKLSGGKFSKATAFFQPIADEPDSPFTTSPAASAEAAFSLEPTLYTFPDPAGIPLRQWVYGDHYIRGFVSATVAPGGLGKSSLSIAEALAMASGKPLLGLEPHGQFRVWLWNGEDPRDELDRRIAAAMRHYGLTPADIGDRLLVDSGMEQEIVLAKESRNGALIVEPMAEALVSALRRKRIDVFVADPFVSSHKVTENDNVSIDLVVKRWGKIAFTTGTSIELVHHVRKTNGAEVTVEDARGASALVNGTRVTRALTRMTDAEGRSLGVADPWRYFRSGGVAKNNLAPAAGAPADRADWFTLKSEQLGNGKGSGVEAIMTGDAVGVVTRAALATMAHEHDPDEVAEALRLIGAGEWRADVRAGDSWVGHAVAQAFKLDASDSSDKTTINGILKQWRRERKIHDVSLPDKSRHNRQFVRVSTAAAKVDPSGSTYGVFE